MYNNTIAPIVPSPSMHVINIRRACRSSRRRSRGRSPGGIGKRCGSGTSSGKR